MTNTKIEWADHSWSPWIGCQKVSAGCANCYAETWADRFGRKFTDRQRTSKQYWRQPLKWNCDHEVPRQNNASFDLPPPNRPRVFPSLCDPLDPDVPIEWLADFLGLIRDTPNLDWLVLSKRPEHWRERMAQASTWCDNNGMTEVASWINWWTDTGGKAIPPVNVWMGVSVENQEYAEKRIPELLKIPAKVRFLSVEPLLGPVRLDRIEEDELGTTMDCLRGTWSGNNEPLSAKVAWVIAGGESGRNARPCNIEWIRDIVRQCRDAQVPVFVKQVGSQPIQLPPHNCNYSDGTFLKGRFTGKGSDMSEWPEEIRVREMPKVER